MNRSAAPLKYYYENKDKVLGIQKEYKVNNREKYNAYQRKYRQARRKNDPMFRFLNSTRVRLARVLKGLKKSKHTTEILGCSLEFFKSHLESQFTSGMNWQNYGNGPEKWNVDHRIPLAMAKTQEDIEKLCHYTNLQPMWSIDNFKKSDHYANL
jgi:hypothetical protein